MKIVVLDGCTLNPGDLSWAGLEQLGQLTVYEQSPLNDDAFIIERIGDADAVFTNKVPITKAVIDGCANLGFIGVLATGYNIIDTAAAKARGIPVCNVPSYSTRSVAQFAIALLLEICFRIGHHADAVKAGRWKYAKGFSFWDYPLLELFEKTIGIVGFGRIGRATAAIARAMGMRVIAYNGARMPSDSEAEYVPLDELFARADVVCLHCPLTDATRGIISADSIAKMKDGAILINTSRGALVDEAALANALRAGKLFAAGLDVVDTEPIADDNELLALDNCLITPHMAWAPLASRSRLMDAITENLKAYIDGAPINVVD